MTSRELKVDDGIELQAGSIAMLCSYIAPVRLVVTAANAGDARDAYLALLNNMPIRTYRNAANTKDITLHLRWTDSVPAGDAWTPGKVPYLCPVQVTADGIYLAYTAAPTGGFNQLEGQIKIDLVN